MPSEELFLTLLSEWQVRFEQLETGVERSLMNRIIPLLYGQEALVISGVRRCGKTFLCYQIARYLVKSRQVSSQNIAYINFEDERLLSCEANDLPVLLQAIMKRAIPGQKIFLFLDEIQEVPVWERWVNRMLEQVHELKIIITGSNAHLLSSEFASLLSGRNVTFTLYPFDFKEFLSYHAVAIDPQRDVFSDMGRAQAGLWFERYLEFGGFPAVQKSGDRIAVLQQYFNDILYRDIVMRFQVRVPRNLERFATYCFFHICQRFTFSRLASVLSMSKETLEEHFEYLTKAHALFGVEFFDFKQAQRLRKPKKMYAIDTGLVKSLGMDFSPNSGHYAENAVFCELLRRNQKVYWWEDGGEIDFIAHSIEGITGPINVCYSDAIPDRELSTFSRLSTYKHNMVKPVVLTKTICESHTTFELVPVWKWMLEK
jgi:hypothetical protein